jgi:hypothetical protein
MPPSFTDISGQRFGRLVALRRGRSGYWVFGCDCGGQKEIFTSDVRLGKTRSCGCLQLEARRQPFGLKKCVI